MTRTRGLQGRKQNPARQRPSGRRAEAASGSRVPRQRPRARAGQGRRPRGLPPSDGTRRRPLDGPLNVRGRRPTQALQAVRGPVATADRARRCGEGPGQSGRGREARTRPSHMAGGSGTLRRQRTRRATRASPLRQPTGTAAENSTSIADPDAEPTSPQTKLVREDREGTGGAHGTRGQSGCL